MQSTSPYHYPAPGPLGAYREFMRDPFLFFEKLHALQEPIVRFRMAHRHLHLVTDIDLIKDMLKRWQVFEKGLPAEVPQILGNGLVFAEGQDWVVQRKVMSPALHRKALLNYEGTMQMQARLLCERMDEQLQDHSTINLSKAFYTYSVRVLRDCLFGKEVPEGRLQEVLDAIPQLMAHSFKFVRNPVLLPLWVPMGRNRKTKARMHTIAEVVMEVVQAREKLEQPESVTFVDMLLRGAEDGTTLTYENLIEQVKIFFVAGTETSANTLAFAFHFLDQHPQVLARLQAEIDEVMGSGDVTFEKLQECHYLHGVVSETLRLYPATWTLSRSNVEATQLGPYSFQAGRAFMFSPYAQHRNADAWEDPLAFRPERWANPSSPPPHYLPFIQGPRRCIGEQFALLEIRMLIATLVQRYQWQVPATFTPQVAPVATLSFSQDLTAKVTPRR